MNNNYEIIRNETLDNVYSLPSRVKEAVILRYGLDGEGHKTYKQIGDIIGRTTERARQYVNCGIKLLRMMHKQEVSSPDQLVYPGKPKPKKVVPHDDKPRFFEPEVICSSEKAQALFEQLKEYDLPWLKQRDTADRENSSTYKSLKSMCYGTTMAVDDYNNIFTIFVHGKDGMLFFKRRLKTATANDIIEDAKVTYHLKRVRKCCAFKVDMLNRETSLRKMYAEVLSTLAPRTKIATVYDKWRTEQTKILMERRAEERRQLLEEERLFHERMKHSINAKRYRDLCQQRKAETKRMIDILSECVKRAEVPVHMQVEPNFVVLFITYHLDYRACILFKHETACVSQYEQSMITCRYGLIRAIVNYSCNMKIEPNETDYQSNTALIEKYLKFNQGEPKCLRQLV